MAETQRRNSFFSRAELMDPESAGVRTSTNLQSCTYLLVVGGNAEMEKTM